MEPDSIHVPELTQDTFLDFSADFGHILAGYDNIYVASQIYD